MEPTTIDHGRDQPTDQLERITLDEAAERLAVSVNAVRQRIKRGTLAGDRSTTPWSVLWSKGRSQLTSGQPSTDQATTRPVSPDRMESGRIDDLQRRISDLELDRDRWHEEAQRNAGQLEHEQESVRGLIVALARAEQRAELAEGRIEELLVISETGEPPQAAPQSTVEAEATTHRLKSRVETVLAPLSASWWDRFKDWWS